MISRHGRQYVPYANRRKITTIGVVILILVILFAVPVTHRAIRYVAGGIGNGFVRAAKSIGSGFSSIGTGFRSKRGLVKENDALKAQLAEFEARIGERDLLARENDELKSAMERSDSAQFILSAVLTKPPRSAYDTLIIDGGEKAGIVVGQVVYANGHTPIGVVSESRAQSAVVLLYSAPRQETQGRLSPSNIDVTLVGSGGGSFVIEAPHELSVPDTAVVVTKEINPKIIATFVAVTSDPRDPFQELLFASPVNMQHLSFVQVRQ